MADIGEEQEPIIFEPFPAESPIQEPAAPATPVTPAKEPARTGS